MPLLNQSIWGHIWTPTLEINHTNASNVTGNLPSGTNWANIWKLTLRKTKVFRQEIFGHAPKTTKNWTNATNVTLWRQFYCWPKIRQRRGQTQRHAYIQRPKTLETKKQLGQAIWRHIWKSTLTTNAICFLPPWNYLVSAKKQSSSELPIFPKAGPLQTGSDAARPTKHFKSQTSSLRVLGIQTSWILLNMANHS